MTLMDTAQLLGNLGEFVGAIAVVLTLIYLAFQVRHSREAVVENTRAVRSSTYEAYNQSGSSWADLLARHASSLAAIEEHTNLDQLTQEQLMLHMALGTKTFNMMEATYLHHRAGSLDDDVFEAKVTGFRVYLEMNPLLRQFWREGEDGGGGLTREFRGFMEDRVPCLRHEEP